MALRSVLENRAREETAVDTILDNKTLTGTRKNGQILLDEPADWPEGCRVVVAPSGLSEVHGMAEGERSNYPEAIAKWLAEFDAIPPWPMSPGEEAEWLAARQAVKYDTIAKMNEPFSEDES
jgi:hypothetical protein